MKLLEHFKELSLHPKNVEKLKGLILQLAVQGKLTASWRAENSNIESAAFLFHKIQEEKTELIKEKKIRNELVKKRFAKSTTEFEVPDTWKSCNLTDVYYTIGGKENQLKTKEYQDKGSYPVVSQGKNLIEGYSNDESKVLQILKPVVVFGDHTRVIKLIDFDFIIGADGVKVLVPCSHILSEYFFFYLSSIDLSSRGYARHYSHLKNEPFSLPPVEEQKAIVEVVNTLFKEVEQLESLTKERLQLKECFVVSALNRLTEAENTQEEWNFLQKHFSSFFTEKKNIKSLRETILQLAVQGKLTKSWRANNPNIELASELLKRIEAEKQQLIAEKKIKKEKPLPPIKEDEMPYELPEGWVWCMSKGLFQYEQGIQVDKNLQLTSPEEGYVRFLRIVDFTQNTDDIRYVKHPGEKYIIDKDNLVMVRYGASAGFIGTDLSGVLANNLFKIHYGLLVKNYVRLVFKSPYFETELKLNTKGGAMPAINFGFLNKFIFPLPSLKEQKLIVEKVNSLMTLCDKLEQQINNSQTQIEQLMQSCLKEVFEYESN